MLAADATFLDGTWEDALGMTAEAHPLVSTLICADLVDRAFVAGARARGAFDVLWKPVELEQLRRGIRAAHEAAIERRLWLAELEFEHALGHGSCRDSEWKR